MKIRNLFAGIAGGLASVLPFAAGHEGETHIIQKDSILLPAVGIVLSIIFIAIIFYLLRKK